LLDSEISEASGDGFFEKDDQCWGTIKSWSSVLQISRQSIRKSLQRFNSPLIRGKDHGGRLFDFYSEATIRTACSDMLNSDYPKADEFGFFEKDMERWGTIFAWSRVLPISANGIRRNLQKSDSSSIKGKDQGGRVRNFYCESSVRSACSEQIEPDLLQADPTGFFEKDGDLWGVMTAWARVLQISGTTIKKYLQKTGVSPIKGRNHRGYIYDFYSEVDVLTACADLLSAKGGSASGGEKHQKQPNPKAA